MNRDAARAAIVYVAFIVACGAIGGAAGLLLRHLAGLLW